MRLLTEIKELDTIHLVIDEDKKRWDRPGVLLRSYVEVDTAENIMDRFGLQVKRPAILYPSVGSLIEAELGEQDPQTFRVRIHANIGDHFGYSGDEYEILSVISQVPSGFGNNDRPFHYALIGDLWHPTTESFETQSGSLSEAEGCDYYAE